MAKVEKCTATLKSLQERKKLLTQTFSKSQSQYKKKLSNIEEMTNRVVALV
jgi:hypothetical protein